MLMITVNDNNNDDYNIHDKYNDANYNDNKKSNNSNKVVIFCYKGL